MIFIVNFHFIYHNFNALLLKKNWKKIEHFNLYHVILLWLVIANIRFLALIFDFFRSILIFWIITYLISGISLSVKKLSSIWHY